MKSEKLSEDMKTRLAAIHTDILKIIKDSSAPLETLLENIAVAACKHSDSYYAAVGLLNNNKSLKNLITVSANSDHVEKIETLPEGLLEISRITVNQSAIRINDLSELKLENFTLELEKPFAFLSMPIIKEEKRIGHIFLFKESSSGNYSQDDQDVIELLATYAGPAICNANLYWNLSHRESVLTKRNENLALLNQLAITLSSTAEIEQMLEKVLDQVMEYLHLEAGEIFLRHEDNITLTLVLHHDKGSGTFWKKDQFEINEGIVGKTAFIGEPNFLNLSKDSDPFLKKDIQKKGLKHIVCFPLNAGSEILGVLCIANDHAEQLDELELQFLAIISSWVGTVIDNARLNLQQRRLAVLEERERIGMDLHDGVIQSIYAVGLTLEHARLLMADDPQKAQSRIVQAISDLNNTIRDIRSYILDLRPHHLHEENLLQGIQRLVNEFRANTQVEVNLAGSMEDFKNLPNAPALALFHICQEALANVAKHAKAENVDVTLWTSADRALMEVHDDGHGFDLKKIKFTLGHGLSNMQTRARNVGGEVDITSEPGSGTTTLAWVPFPRTLREAQKLEKKKSETQKNPK